MKRKIEVVLLCGILAISSLAGCGNAGEEKAEPVIAEEQDAEDETPIVEDETPIAEDETVKEVTGDVETEEPEQEEKKYICLAKTDYNADGSVETLTKYIYNESGNILKEISYGADSAIKSSTEYEYGENDRCVKFITYDADGNITGSTEYADIGIGLTEYDADGNVISTLSREEELDDNGNPIKTTYSQTSTYDGRTSTFGGVTEYEYDDDNRQIKVISYEEDGSTIQNIYEYAYDSAGNCITETNYGADGAVYSIKNNEYDSDNNVVKEMETNADGTGYVLWEYEYDSHGNKIKESISNNYDYFSSSRLVEYEYDTSDRRVRETYYSDGALQSINCMGYDDYGCMSREIEYYAEESEYQTSGITEYKYMELQDYLTAKESLDEEEVEIVNTESVENMLSGLGISIADTEGME